MKEYFFESNCVGDLKRRIWEADDAELDSILKAYELPPGGGTDKPGCYIQNTLRHILGSTELHGFHCASGQDTLQAARIREVVRRYTARRGREVNLALSPWLCGNHPKHHVGMLGTIQVSPSVGTPEGVVGRATLASAVKAKRPVAAALQYLTMLHDDILDRFPPGTLPPVEEVTLGESEIAGYLGGGDRGGAAREGRAVMPGGMTEVEHNVLKPDGDGDDYRLSYSR